MGRQVGSGTPTCESRSMCQACHAGWIQGLPSPKKEPANIEYINFSDGRIYCSDCYSIATIHPDEYKPLIQKVHDFFKSLNLDVDENISIFFVDRNEMSRLDKSWTEGYTIFHTCAITKIDKCMEHGEKVEVETTSTTTSGITILLLFGRPDVMMGGTLAHEMMHVWLRRVKGCKTLERKVEEGICEVMSYKWMEEFCEFCSSDVVFSSCKVGNKQQVDYRAYLTKYCTALMENRKDQIYGQGFREAKEAVDKFGLKSTLHHIVKKGSLPKYEAKAELKHNHDCILIYRAQSRFEYESQAELKPNQTLLYSRNTMHRSLLMYPPSM